METSTELGKAEILANEEYRAGLKELDKKLNIMIVGPAGIGKSTLINALFGIDLAKTGVGKPVTTRVSAFTKGNLKIYDTAGIEMDEGKRDTYADECISVINQQLEKGDDEQIHLIMYCLQAPRLQTVETEYLSKLSKCACFGDSKMSIPVIIVNPRPYNGDIDEINRFYEEEVTPTFKKLFPFNSDYTVHEVQAITIKTRRGTNEEFGLDELVQTLNNRAPEARRYALIRALREGVDLKCAEAKKISNKYIALGAGTAVGSSITGIPDAMALLGIELAMCAHMGTIFNFALDTNRVRAMVEASLKTVAVASAASLLGHTVMAALTFGGSIAIEAAARSGIAAVAIKSLSVTFIDIMKKYSLGELDDEQATQLLIKELEFKKSNK